MTASKIKLLLVEPEPDDASKIQAALVEVAPRQFAITHAENMVEAAELIDKNPFDVVLLDAGMTDTRELDSCCHLSQINPSLPYIVLGDEDNLELALAAVKHGAQDYLNKKKATGRALIRVVRYAIERKRSEENLQTNKEGAQQLLEYADEGIYSVDLNGNCTFINPSALRMLGYNDESQLLGKHIHPLIHHTRADGTPCLDKECRVYTSTRSGKVFHVDDEVLWRADGSSFPVEYRTAPTRVNGVINGSVVTFSDITQRKQVESELKAAHDQLDQRVKERTRRLEKVNQLLEIEIEDRIKAQEVLNAEREFISTLLDTVGALVCVLDKEGRFVMFNRACEETTGYRFEEVKGKYVWDLFLVKEEIEPVTQVFRNLQAGMFPNRFENYWLTRDGEKRMIVWTNTVLLDDDGVVKNIIGTGIDITEKRKIEEKEKQRVLELAHVSRLSTMGEMATQIAHELNQPLSAISTYSDAGLYMLKSLPEENADLVTALREIKHQAQRSGDIIRGLRNFVSKGELQTSTTDINALVHSVLNLAMSELRNNKVEVNFSLDEALPLIITEKILIEQVILNLVRNAIDAIAEANSRTRKVHIHTLLNKDKMIEVRITDTGPGLNAEQIESIFDTFVTTKPQGIGMGLPISRTIIEAHGGKLFAERQRKNGASFVFTLPLKRLE
jgi:two-component system sensor histidine kinase DctS